MDKCVQLAWRDFHAFFRDAILDLVATFPADAKTKSGEPFWSGHKLFPQALEFDIDNQLHKEFLISAANLYACVFKVLSWRVSVCLSASLSASLRPHALMCCVHDFRFIHPSTRARRTNCTQNGAYTHTHAHTHMHTHMHTHSHTHTHTHTCTHMHTHTHTVVPLY